MHARVAKIRDTVRRYFAGLAAKSTELARRAYDAGVSDFQKQHGASAFADSEHAELRVVEAVTDLGLRAESAIVHAFIAAQGREPDWRDDVSERLTRVHKEWLRLCTTELAIARQLGYADAVRSLHGDDAEVTFVPADSACRWCRVDHLDDSGAPRKFKLSALGANKRGWRAVAGVAHPGCLCAMQFAGEAALNKSLNAEFVGPSVMENRNVGSGATGSAALFNSPVAAAVHNEPSEYAADIIKNSRGPVYIHKLDPEVWNNRAGPPDLVHPLAEYDIESFFDTTPNIDIVAEHREFVERWAATRAKAAQGITSKT